MIIGIMGIKLLPGKIGPRFLVADWRHAGAILAGDFPDELYDITDFLDRFAVSSAGTAAGRTGKQRVTPSSARFLESRRWARKSVTVTATAAHVERRTEYLVGFSRSNVGIELLDGGSDDRCYQRLAGFRALHSLGLISVGVVIVVPSESVRPVSARTHTVAGHWGELRDLVDSGEGAPCPLLLIGLRGASAR
jgi:hypothetical protein